MNDDPFLPQSIRAVRALARTSRLLERTCADLSLAQYRVLSAVSAGDERASRIAARLRLGKPAISAAVDSLTSRGLLERGSAEADQRVVVLRLTRAGAALLERTEADMAERIADLARHCPDPAALLEALGWLDHAIEAARTDAAIRR